MNLCVRSIYLFLFIGLLVGPISQAQDTLRIDDVIIESSRLKLKKKGLYDGELIEEYNIRGFTQNIIFENDLVDFWTSEDVNCVDAKIKNFHEDKALNIVWNKDQDGCDWVGFGIGWDGWKSKDIGYVIDTLAIELVVRSTAENFTNIPWAFCLEDYKGAQAWLGYNLSFLDGDFISKKWTKVILPISLFPFDEFDTDPSNIKQLLVQLFSEGEIEIQSIKLVPFAGKLKHDFYAKSQDIIIDGDLSDWTDEFEMFNGQQVGLSYSNDFLYIAFIVNDSTPLQNNKLGNELWNGDAVEVAFSTNPQANDKRKFLLLSDQHIGINCGSNPYIWNFKTNEIIPDSKLEILEVNTGYVLEASIPLDFFNNLNLQSGINLDVEVAIDLGTYDSRQSQIRWNSNNKEGFHQNPSLWGNLILE